MIKNVKFYVMHILPQLFLKDSELIQILELA